MEEDDNDVTLHIATDAVVDGYALTMRAVQEVDDQMWDLVRQQYAQLSDRMVAWPDDTDFDDFYATVRSGRYDLAANRPANVCPFHPFMTRMWGDKTPKYLCDIEACVFHAGITEDRRLTCVGMRIQMLSDLAAIDAQLKNFKAANEENMNLIASAFNVEAELVVTDHQVMKCRVCGKQFILKKNYDNHVRYSDDPDHRFFVSKGSM